MKSLLFLFILAATVSPVNADVAKPKPSPKQILHTSLEIVPDAKLYEAKLQISQSDFNNLRAAAEGTGSSPVVGGIVFSAPRRSSPGC